MNIEAAYNALQQNLIKLYDSAEAANITDWIIESITGKRRSEWMFDKGCFLDDKQQLKLEQYTLELLEYRPVQYVLGESYFYGMKLYVDENVLIPRPETEELTDWLLKYQKTQNIPSPIIADIGTGSGCLALAIKKDLPEAEVYAIDISIGALSVAQKNAHGLGLDVHFLQMDILQPSAWNNLPTFDIIISNPPYITLPEKESILPNVLQYEPHNALFVTDNDPLQFYKTIESFAEQKLTPKGSVFLELHKDFALETKQYFIQKGWVTVLKKDMQDRERMLHCYKD